MNWIDAAIVILFLYFIVTGFSAGLVREVIGITSAVFGVVMAGLFYDDIADTLLGSIDNQTTAEVVAFLIVAGGITLAGQLVAMVVHPVITVVQLGIADQLMGAAFGAAKGFVIVEALLVLFVTYPRYDLNERINDSSFAGVMLDGSQPIVKILPEIFEKKVDAFK